MATHNEFTPAGKLYRRLFDNLGARGVYFLGIEISTDPMTFIVRVRLRPLSTTSCGDAAEPLVLRETVHEFPSEQLVATILLYANAVRGGG